MSWVSAQLAGLDAETFTTAFHAYRRPDSPGETRTTEQAGADALVAMARAALDAGTAPTRKTRPQVTVHIPLATLNDQPGAPAAEGAWTGPLPRAEVRRLLADCNVGRLLVDARSLPLEASESVRTVLTGLYRQLEVRDRGCIAVGCDQPPPWCQVMHLDTPYRFGGRLSPATAALGCPHHHHAYDHLGWTITWHNHRPILHHPDRPPDLGPAGPSPANGPTDDAHPSPANGRRHDALHHGPPLESPSQAGGPPDGALPDEPQPDDPAAPDGSPPGEHPLATGKVQPTLLDDP